MLKLDTVNKSLEIKLAGAVATTELPFVCSYSDGNQLTFAQAAWSSSDGVTNGATAVGVSGAAVPANTTRQIQYVSVVNVDTAAVTLTVQVNNTGTKRITFKATLQIGDQLSFTDASGWVVFDSTGSLKEGFSGVLPAASFPALTGDVTTTVGSLVTTIGALKVTNAMLAGSIAASKLIGTDIATVGTITAGVWNAGGITTSGLFTGTAVGDNKFTGAGAGANVFRVVNTTSGAGAHAYFRADAGSTNVYVFSISQGYSTSGVFIASSGIVYTDAAAGLSFAADNATGVIRFYTGGQTLRAQINANGTQTWAPYGSGAATFDASGNITSVSDARFKDRIAPLPYGLSEVLQLRPVQHGYNEISALERDHLYGGFIAQEVQPVMPLAVGCDARGYLTLADRPILGAVVNAIRTLEARLVQVEGR